MLDQQKSTGPTARQAARALVKQLEPQPKPAKARGSKVATIARSLGLKIGALDDLTIRRLKRGKGWSFQDAAGKAIRDKAEIKRLNAMAMPPAYEEVRYATDPTAHLQAVGRDAAGRLQYRYHADWEKVREHRKAQRLEKLVGALPKIRRAVTTHLSSNEPTREFALAAVIETIARTAIRPGSESYAKLNGTRGATTLLKSNVVIEDDCVILAFKAKGGKAVRKECGASRLVRAIEVLKKVPGRRLFQYFDANGDKHNVSTSQVNNFLREIAGIKISLKDFRTLMASAVVVESLARISPATSAAGRKRQVREAVETAANELANTPAICRKSYVHDTIVTAFEDGLLERFASTIKGSRSQSKREQLLAQVVTAAA